MKALGYYELHLRGAHFIELVLSHARLKRKQVLGLDAVRLAMA
jgi:hypothetical protein